LAPEEWGTGWAFEGPPLVADADIYVAMRRRENMRAQIHVVCFRMKPNRAEFRWGRSVASAETIGQGRAVEYTHNLLTLDQGVLYVNTNQGAVAALRAQDGEVLWITQYPRVPVYGKKPGHPNSHVFRDLNPCLVQKDIVVVAPQDCDQVFALDAATGMVLWNTGPERAVDVAHLLGIVGGHLIASGHRLYWIDVHNGRIAGSFPARVQDDFRGYGRGILAGGNVYWPTRGEIHVFDVGTMRMVRQPINLRAIGMMGGNLLVADGVMLVAGANKLAAFNAYGRQIAPAEDTMPVSNRGSGDQAPARE
jgi:outer membrane protein assembly factor BamB